ncbi:MAG: hypothetical protein QF614_04825, partial [SAR324 cluster bacterium]|nr:hypothetical protein [SAR324 cluster bacterium]
LFLTLIQLSKNSGLHPFKGLGDLIFPGTPPSAREHAAAPCFSPPPPQLQDNPLLQGLVVSSIRREPKSP